MTDAGDSSDSSEDARFEALLRRAAQLPAAAPVQTLSHIRPGALVCGGRFQVLSQLGEGGMGVVYQAFDRLRSSTVALKTVSQLDARAIYRLKNEFRSLAEVLHPNLVQLYELFADEGQWLFSMELIEGEPFDQHVRPHGQLDLARLREALRQLVTGVRVIHAAGKLHRDLKPSNVLVTRGGRVVILDFGLAADPDPDPDGAGQSDDPDVAAGTPAYMAPEQAAGLDATAASDWYGVGATLFEALTSKLPFDGRAPAILVDKQLKTAPLASTLAADVPADLDALCAILLARDPCTRPNGERIAELVGVGLDSKFTPSPSLPPPAPAALLGRDGELARLRAAYEQACAGQPSIVHLAGESGVGKSTLCAAFLQELRAAGHAVVLSGRCYERESVPYKAFDRVVDGLSRYLRQLPAVEAAALMPRGAAALSRVFPVLASVPSVAATPLPASADEGELRKLAFAAFTELLSRIRDRRPLVLCIDDLQWTDHDSSLLFEQLFATRPVPPLLLIACHRGVVGDHNAALARTLQALREHPVLAVTEIVLEALPLEAATLLARALLTEASIDRARAAEVARESGGNPFFVGELCRYVVEALTHGERPIVGLEHAIERRLARAGAAAGKLLELLAVAARPLPLPVLAAACSADIDVHGELHVLRASQLVAAAGERGYECYHDRIRVALVERVPEDQRRTMHRALAQAWLAQGDADPEALFEHFLAAGDDAQARQHAVAAAERALKGLAFDRGAALYRQAIALLPQADTEALELHERLADALSRAGRWAEAAQAFAIAAEQGGERSPHREQQAALHFLGSGRYEQGMPRLQRSFQLLGLAWPRTRLGAALGAGVRLLWLRIVSVRALRRGVAKEPALAAPRSSSSSSSPGTELAAVMPLQGEELTMNVLLSAAGLVPNYDLVRGLYHVSAFVSYSLSCNDQGTRALGLAMFGTLLSAWRWTRDVGVRLTEHSLSLIDDRTRPDVAAAVFGFAGYARALDMRYEEARALGARGSARLQNVGRAYVYHAWGARTVQCYALFAMGRGGEAAELLAATANEAHERGDELALVGGDSVFRFMVEDDLAGAERLLARKEAFLAGIKSEGLLRPIIAIERVSLALYRGRGPDELAFVGRVSAVGLTQLQPLSLLAACAAQAMERDGTRPELLRIYRKVRRVVADLPDDAVRGFVQQLDATLAFLDGRPAEARERLTSAAEYFERAGMNMHTELMRYRCAQLDASEESQRAVREIEGGMHARGLRNPGAWARLIAPGFDRARPQ